MMSLDRLWVTGLLRRRGGRVAAAALGVAVAVALVATLAGFFVATQAAMTRQAIADVAVDWQVLLAPGADPEAVIAELRKSPGVSRMAQVGYADTLGIEATTGGTVQTTGPGKVLGLDPKYRVAFPGEICDLVGD